VESRHQRSAILAFNRLASIDRDAKVLAKEELSRSRAETNDDARANHFELRLEPWLARRDVPRTWFLVKSLGAAGLPAKVLDDVREIDFASIDPCLFERAIKQPASRPYKGLPFDILLVAWHLANEHHRRTTGTTAEHSLRPLLVKLTPFACFRRLTQGREVQMIRKILRGGVST
jgi:hypothetical protein